MIFIDTWAWVALAIPEDQYHSQATETYRQLLGRREPMVTSDYILGETITFLFGRTQQERAVRFMDAILNRISQKQLRLEYVDRTLFQRAWELRKQYHDKPGISFTDFTSIAVMDAQQITRIFSGDEHFVQVNRGFQLL